MLKNIRHVLKAVFIVGKQRQSFLSASWIPPFLRLVPTQHKQKAALWIVSLSPHYFYRQANPSYKNMAPFEFWEAEFRRNAESRQQICEQILSPHLKKKDTVLDYGCGPGFLAKCVSEKVKQVFAADISTGVLECAKILNAAENITYLTPEGFKEKAENNSVDAVYSFAVVQHVTDAVFEIILKDCRDKLKTEGTLLFHLILNDGCSEAEWRKDVSLYGKIKWHYGLNCFSRDELGIRHLFEKCGFSPVEIVNLKDICKKHFDDICEQHMVIAKLRTGGAQRATRPPD